MNILVICHYGLYSNLSSSFVHNQVREYAAMGHRVRAIIPIGLGKTDRRGSRLGRPLTVTKADGVELYELRYVTLSSYGEGGFNLRSAIAALKAQYRTLFRDFVPDVIHAHTLGFDTDLGAWLKEKWNCPLVVTSHGSDAVVPMKQGRQEALKKSCDKADRIIAVSNPLGELIRSCGTVTPVQTIHNGFVLREYPEKVEKDPFSIIQACNLIPSKKVDVTIRAFAQLKARWPQLRLTIAGNGPERETLETLAKRLQVADAVSFLGHIPNDKLFEKMAQSRFFVMASAPEGFGIVYLEAMWAGCITVGTQGQGIADVIRHGENGFLVPPDDPDAIAAVMEQCLEMRERAGEVARAGQTLAQGMSWPVNAQACLHLFSDLRND